ncbi:MAG: epoxyqueuosine reductase QueH [Ruminococcus sp.]|jgi:predicted adenine nucleotide alpha hydrolase (AANH) superfamily ATPase|nr:epoxyqueuosine reductase QueH [Ruminococcus sp.]
MFNLQQETEKVIANLKEHIPSLVLHTCCAPCGSYSLEFLSQYFDITAFFYNPNIQPPDEYHRRLNEVLRLVKEMPFKNPVSVFEGNFDNEKWLFETAELRDEPEGGARCDVCFRLRLFETAKFAREMGAEYFGTTLSISPHKDARKLYEISLEAEKIYGVKALPLDLKKKNGYKRSIELSKQYSLYRQSYCGCDLSK